MVYRTINFLGRLRNDYYVVSLTVCRIMSNFDNWIMDHYEEMWEEQEEEDHGTS